MTRINFYRIRGDETDFACRLVSKVYRRGHQVYVHTAGEAQARQFDDLLWSFRPDSFVPHGLQECKDKAPVMVGFDREPDGYQDVLVNLSAEVPTFFSRFDRVAELVPADDFNRGVARRRYVFYKDRGYSIDYYKL